MRLWIALTLGIIISTGGVWWLTRPVEEAAGPHSEVAEADSERPLEQFKERAVREAKVSNAPRQRAHEPIAVLPESDAMPESPLGPPIVVSRNGSERSADRPEAGHEPRAWMPYAGEDRELAQSRKAAWDRLVPRDLEETAEPPLGEIVERSRSLGRPPCVDR